MKLTRRGWVALAIVVAAMASGAAFGPRGLNAVAAPGAVVLVAGAVQVWRFDRPSLERDAPSRGHRGETVPVRLHFDGGGPFSARLYDAVGEGLDARGNERETTIGRGRGVHEYELHLEERGERTLGPVTVTARDVLGLVSTTFRYDRRHRLLVRPRVYVLAGTRREDLVRLYGGASDDRQQFDHLREYERGDPLRDVHWKSSAKLPDFDLAVKEFATEEGSQVIEVVGEAAPGCDDEMAEALASVATDLLEAGVQVVLTTPDGRFGPDSGSEFHDELLDHLARVGPGGLHGSDRSRASVLIDATPGGVSVDIEGSVCRFGELAGTGIDEAPGERPDHVAPRPPESEVAT